MHPEIGCIIIRVQTAYQEPLGSGRPVGEDTARARLARCLHDNGLGLHLRGRPGRTAIR